MRPSRMKRLDQPGLEAQVSMGCTSTIIEGQEEETRFFLCILLYARCHILHLSNRLRCNCDTGRVLSECFRVYSAAEM